MIKKKKGYRGAIEVLIKSVHYRGTNFNKQYEYEQCINGIIKSKKKTQTKNNTFFK